MKKAEIVEKAEIVHFPRAERVAIAHPARAVALCPLEESVVPQGGIFRNMNEYSGILSLSS